MKAAVFLAALAFANTCTTTGGPVEQRTIHTGSYAAAKPEQKQAVAALDEEQYRRLWPTLIGGGEPPSVDFASESVVFLLGGSKPTGGWSVVPRGSSLDGTTLVIDAAVQGPPPDVVTTQAFTSPFAVIAVKNKAFKDVRW